MDNIWSCECEECPQVVIEYKCPWKHRTLPPKEAFLTPELGGQQIGNVFSLKSTSGYFYQVQLQMFVHNLQLCHFVVWTTLGVFTVQVPFQRTFITTVVAKLQTFWVSHVLPSMMHDDEPSMTTAGGEGIVR